MENGNRFLWALGVLEFQIDFSEEKKNEKVDTFFCADRRAARIGGVRGADNSCCAATASGAGDCNQSGTAQDVGDLYGAGTREPLLYGHQHVRRYAGIGGWLPWWSRWKRNGWI